VCIWDAVTFEELAKLEGHHKGVNSVAFSPDGTHIGSGSDDYTMRIWNAVTFEELAKLEGHQASISHVVFSPDGTIISSRDRTGGRRAWACTQSNNGKFAYQSHIASC
jgi:WD40 repeat protein